ncbi:hypothetical protein [Brevibacillus laterosporus]|uniref:hypothetical protein n=1 Tax=Brevibacillus laterosporus TaxID=1465 RepID=UPI003D227499
MFFEPRVRTGLWLKSHYNIMIVMQHTAIKRKPALLRHLFAIGEWRVKRLDIAFDWSLPMSKHFILKPVNVKMKEMGNGNYYLYGQRNELSVCMYDKKKELAERKGIVIDDENMIRLELRVRPKIKNQRLLDGDFSWLKKQFDRIFFVPNGTAVIKSLKRENDKRIFRNVKRRRMQEWSGVDRQTRKRIREAVKFNAVDLFELFQQYELHKDILWNAG